jgi:PBP1b-binding outer membrane lipoprotein LpoB
VGSKATKMEVFHHVHHIIVVALVAAGCVAVELANAVEGSKDNRKFLVPTARDGTRFILQVDTHLDTSELQDINTQLLEKKDRG